MQIKFEYLVAWMCFREAVPMPVAMWIN